MQPYPDRAECQVAAPVRLLALGDPAAAGGAVQLPDKPIVACRFAEGFGDWLAGAVVPVVASRMGTPLAAVETGPGTECRPRNRAEGAKVSAHGTGLAIDVAAIQTGRRQRFVVEPRPASAVWVATFRAVRRSACGWFTTVLGPLSDPYHSNHLHLDIQQHGRSDRYRICQ